MDEVVEIISNPGASAIRNLERPYSLLYAEYLQVHTTIAGKGHVYPILQQVGSDFFQDKDDASQAEAESEEVALWPPDNGEHVAKHISGNLRTCHESRR